MRGTGHDRASAQECSMISRKPAASRAVSIAVSLAVTASTFFAGSVPASATAGDPIAASVPTAAAPSAVAPAAPSIPVPDPAAPAAAEVPQPRMEEYAAADYAQAAAELPAGLVEAASRDLGKSGAEYLATADAAADAVQVVDALKDRGIDVLGSRLEGTVLTVSVESAADAKVVAATGAVAEVGEPDTRDFSSIDFSAATDLYGGQGYTWKNKDGTAGQCSVGFTGYQVSSGQDRFVTAGHCLAAMTGISGRVAELFQRRAGDPGQRSWDFGLPVSGSGAYGGGYDSGLITSDDPTFSPRPGVLTWGGGAGEPLATTPLPVVGQSAAIAGSVLCKSGSSTGWSCGNVLAVDQTVKVSGADVNAIVTDACVQPGDSGGAAVTGPVAVGIVSGATTVPCGDPAHFSVLFPMVSAAGGASVQAKYGATWEPAIAVATPVVTGFDTGSSLKGGSISGTLALASKESRVRVYIDDMTVPAATLDASSGTWSMSFPALRAGWHSYSVVAGWGSWSRSRSNDQSFQVPQVPTIGDVVRVPGGALYLLDGASRMIRVPSAALVAEFSARPIVDVTAKDITAYTIDTSATLGIAVLCRGQEHLAGSGKLWPPAERFGSESASGLPVTALDPATCDTFRFASQHLNRRVLLRSPATGAIYFLDEGVRHPVVSMVGVYTIANGEPTYVPLSEGALATIRKGREILTPATLAKSASSPTVYFIDGLTRKVPLASFDTAAEFGVSGFATVSEATLNAYKTAPSPLTPAVDCGRTYMAGGGRLHYLRHGAAGLPSTPLSRDTCNVLDQYVPPGESISGEPFLRSASGAIFYVQNGKKSPLTTMGAVTAFANGWVPPFVSLSQDSLNRIPTGRELLGPGRLVKTAASPVVYMVDGLNRKVPIDSFDLAAEFGAIGYTTVPGSVLGAYTSAPANLTLAVTCRSSTYLGGGGSLWTLSSGSTFGLRPTALDGRTCGAFRESAEPVGNALFVRNPATGAVYNVADGRKAYMATMADIYSRNGGVLPAFVPLSSPVLAKLPTA